MAALSQRVFKTKWFTKAAADAGVSDAELCQVARALIEGKGDNLGGNVWKKRLDRNSKRGIVINKVGRFWVFVFLFAKNDRDNISNAELAKFKNLAAGYVGMTSGEIDAALRAGEFVEIFNA